MITLNNKKPMCVPILKQELLGIFQIIYMYIDQ